MPSITFLSPCSVVEFDMAIEDLADAVYLEALTEVGLYVLHPEFET
jgi:hypothetical protein